MSLKIRQQMVFRMQVQKNASKTETSTTVSNVNFFHAKRLSTSAKQDLTDNWDSEISSGSKAAISRDGSDNRKNDGAAPHAEKSCIGTLKTVQSVEQDSSTPLMKQPDPINLNTICSALLFRENLRP